MRTRIYEYHNLKVVSGCIPVIISDAYVLPYADVIDWKRVVLHIYEEDLNQLMAMLQTVTSDRVADMRKSGAMVFHRYFESMGQIANTVLRILNGRILKIQINNFARS